MDENRIVLNQILSDVEKVADSAGIVKCVLITRIYENIKTLDQGLNIQAESWKEEKLKMEAEIQDLKEMLASDGKEQIDDGN